MALRTPLKREKRKEKKKPCKNYMKINHKHTTFTKAYKKNAVYDEKWI